MKTHLIIHHSVESNGFDSVNEYHRQKWHFKSSLGYYIGYHYYIAASGKIHQGRADFETGIHKEGWNDKAIGICLMGNLEENEATEEQLRSLKSLMGILRDKYGIPMVNILGHSELSNTLCPGKNLMPFIEQYRQDKEEVKEEIQKKLSFIAKLIAKLKIQIEKIFKGR